MKKITLAVLFGGSSTEYEISLQSAHAVLTHLDRDRYEPVLLGITRDGRWLLYQGPVDALLDDTWHTDARHTVPAVISPCQPDLSPVCQARTGGFLLWHHQGGGARRVGRSRRRRPGPR